MSTGTNRKIGPLIVAIVLITAAPTFAGKIIYVDDDGPADFNNIQAAINDSNDGDTVTVLDGTYTGTGNKDIDFDGKTITVRSENGPGNCIIDCQDSGRGFYFHNGEDENSIVDGFTITNGNVSSPDWPDYHGGGIYCGNESSPTITNNMIIGNKAQRGGGISAGSYSSSCATIRSNTISGNMAQDGGGIYYRAADICYSDDSAITNNRIVSNTATSLGGGIYCSGSPTITDNIITENTAVDGGGIYCYEWGTISNNTITRNTAQRGGGIFTWEDYEPTIINNIISENWAEHEGGGIGTHDNSPTIIGNLIIGNGTAGNGGGIYLQSAWSLITNNTIAGNRAANGGGISGNGTLTNCILWDNADNGGIDESAQIDGGTPVVNYTCVQGWTGNLGGIGSIGAEPCFVKSGYLDVNGVWVDGDYHLLEGSTCIDAGTNTPAGGLTYTDLDGNPRITYGTVDMGAYEFQGPRNFYVDDNATGANDGSSWTDAYNCLQDALTAAWIGDEIHVAQGIYKPDQGGGQTPGDRDATFQLTNGVAIKGGYAGFGESDPSACDIQLYETILSGDLNGDDVEVGNPEDLLDEPTRAENSYHLVFAGYWTDETAVLDGFTITGGNADGSYPNNGGAGMRNSGDSSPTLANCTFTRNSSTDWGGAVYNKGGLILTNCVLTGNSARGGGGISSKHSDSQMMTIINCIISGNIASEDGGGIESWESHSIIVNSKIFENSARHRGGGIYMDESSSMALTGCTVSRNKAEGGDGGGLYSRFRSYLVITNCIFWDNSDSGGVDESAQVTGSYQINYSCIQGWTGILSGTGSIGVDPLFVDPINYDYHLLPGSPCIDTGDPNYVAGPNETDLDGNPRVINGRIDMGAYEYVPPIPAKVKIIPHTISLRSRGKWIAAFLRLPEDYNVADIDPKSILLEGEIEPERFWLSEDNQIAIAKFDREQVQTILDIGEVELTINGRLTDGTIFEGTDIIKVTDKAGKK